MTEKKVKKETEVKENEDGTGEVKETQTEEEVKANE